MTKKEINICGKQVGIAYCYATEIAFREYVGEDVPSFITATANGFNSGQMPDVKKTVYLLLASIVAYYQGNNQEAPITDNDLLYNASPIDVNNAIAEVIGLYKAWYDIPEGEPEPPKEKKGKKKKN